MCCSSLEGLLPPYRHLLLSPPVERGREGEGGREEGREGEREGEGEGGREREREREREGEGEGERYSLMPSF